MALNKPEKTGEVARPKAPRTREESSSHRTVEVKEKSDIKLELSTPAPVKTKTGMPSQRGQTYGTSVTLSRPPGTATGLRRPGSGAEEGKRSPLVAALGLVAALAAVYVYDPTLLGLLGSGETRITGPAPAAAMGSVEIDGNVRAATVMVEGETKANSLPAKIRVQADRPVKVVIFSNGYKPFKQTVTVGSGGTASILANLEPEGQASQGASDAGTGVQGTSITLKVVVSPPGVGNLIRINGSVVDTSGVVSVQTERGLELTVERDGFRTHKESFVIRESELGGRKDFNKEITLQQARFGFVSIKTTPSAEAVITIDGVEEKWTTPVSRKRVPVGSYKVRLVNSLLGMEKEVQFTVNEDRFTSIEERLSFSDGNRVPTGQ